MVPTVTLNRNRGTGGSDVNSVNYGEKLSIPDNPTRTGFTFKGWTVSETVTQSDELFLKDSFFDLEMLSTIMDKVSYTHER